MSVHLYRYLYNGHVGRLIVGQGDEPYAFQTDDGYCHPLSLDDVIDLDTAEAAFLAQADAIVGAWRELCESTAELPDPQAARQTLRECVEVMNQAIDTDGGPDPAPALALDRAA